MQNPTTVQDLEPRFRPLTDAEKTNAEAWLADAWEELQARVPNLQQRHDAGLVTDGLIRRVVAAMVVRVLRNPDGVKQFASDEASYTRDRAVADGLLYVSADELALLSGTAAGLPLEHLSFSSPYPRS